ncbi:MAG: alpha/beta hydrolase [Pseudomonadales bacterium]
MEPLFFGPADKTLYGVYHGSARPRPRSGGVVLFYPTGQEYMRIHRAYRWLADRLADMGFHVLRFDYSGQGNSAGGFADADLQAWQHEGHQAIEELQAIGGCEHIALVGTRLGATIAAANCQHPLVDQLVLWEPRTPGSVLADEIAKEIASGEWPLVNFQEADGTTHLNGFAYPAKFVEQIQESKVDAEQLAGLREVLCITSVKDLDPAPFAEAAKQLGVAVEKRFAPGPTDWNRVNGIGGVFLPQRILHDISDWLDGAQR